MPSPQNPQEKPTVPGAKRGTLVQATWFGIDPATSSGMPPRRLKAADPNPAVAVFGPGPSDARCGTCDRFVRHQHGRRRYGKCRLRGITHGDGTDHYPSWPACGQYLGDATNASESTVARDPDTSPRGG